MLYKRIARDDEWPLELKTPNKETIQAFEETDRGVGLKEIETCLAKYNLIIC